MILVHSRMNRLLRQITDGAVGGLAFVLAHFVRTNLLDPLVPLQLPQIGELSDYLMFVPLVAVAGPFVLYRLNFYNLTLSQRLGNLFNLTFQAGLILFLLIVVMQFMFKIQMSRIIFIIFVPTYALAIFAREYLSRTLRAYNARRKKEFRNMVVVSDTDNSAKWDQRIRNRPEYGFHVCRTLSIQHFKIDELVRILHNESVQLVVFDVKEGDISKIMEGIRACEEEGIETWFSTDFFETQITEPQIDFFNNQAFLIFRATPDSSWQLFFKECIDRIGALTLLVLLSPIMLAAALAIRFTSEGPIFFRQRRSGHFGHPFVMYKFRSMVTNAEQRKDELKILNEMSGPVFKVSRDPRITPVGKWLRRTSIDELPQLINVLKGEMSLVGPRPLPVDETLAISENAQRRRLSVKPGITCLWQVSGRNEVHSFSEWVRLDLEYIDNWSLGLDFKILLKTPGAVLFGTGAK